MRFRLAALGMLVVLALLPAPAGASVPAVVDLGNIHPQAINSSFDIAGDVPNTPRPGDTRAARWKDGVLTLLQPLSAPVAYNISSATDINKLGDIVGRSDKCCAVPMATRATVWAAAGGSSGIAPAFTNASVPFGDGVAINDGGVVAGHSPNCGGMPVTCTFPQAAIGSAGGTFSLLGPIAAHQSLRVTDINNAGVVVGSLDAGGFGGGVDGGAMWTGGAYSSLGTFFPAAINDDGAMAGRIGSTPYLRSPDGVLTAIGATGTVTAISDTGDVVGYAPGNPWVLHRGTVFHLNDLLPPDAAHWKLKSATGITPDADGIVGDADHDDASVGYRLTPDYPGVELSGTIRSPGGRAFEGLFIDAAGPEVRSVKTGASGRYSAELEPGTYRVRPRSTQIVPAPNQPQCVRTDEGCNVTIIDQDVTLDWLRMPVAAHGDALGEGTGFTTHQAFRVTLDAPAVAGVDVTYRTVDITAQGGGRDADYRTATGTIHFGPGEESKDLDIVVNGDTGHERDETFKVVLTSTGDTPLSTPELIGTIIDDDPIPTISAGDVAIDSPDPGPANLTFAVTLDRRSVDPVTVRYATKDGSAKAPGDYTATAGTLTFRPGEMQRTLQVAVNEDPSGEEIHDERFELVLSDAQNGTIAHGATGTIKKQLGLLVTVTAIPAPIRLEQRARFNQDREYLGMSQPTRKRLVARVRMRNTGNSPITGVTLPEELNIQLETVGPRRGLVQVEAPPKLARGTLAPGKTDTADYTLEARTFGAFRVAATVAAKRETRDFSKTGSTVVPVLPKHYALPCVVRDNERVKLKGALGDLKLIDRRRGQVRQYAEGSLQPVNLANNAFVAPGTTLETLSDSFMQIRGRDGSILVGPNSKVLITKDGIEILERPDENWGVPPFRGKKPTGCRTNWPPPVAAQG